MIQLYFYSYKSSTDSIRYDLKFQAIIKQIMQSSGTIIILRSKNKNISVLNTKYAKHYVKASK